MSSRNLRTQQDMSFYQLYMQKVCMRKSMGKEVPVHQANGIMTAIPVNKGDKVIKLTYTPPQFYLLAIMSFIGVIGSILFSLWVKKNDKLR